jgi:serine/threonine protein kinase
MQDDQPTVISHRPPLPTPQFSDSACRILQGEIQPGDRLEHFELVQYVGGGGMGRVFRAVDTRLQRTVALKILPPDQAADEETLARFRNEAQSAARLDHENIARVYHVGEDQGLHYIVFEFIEGVNVRRLVELKGPMPLAEALTYTLQVAEALVHADARNVVHRDIKPSNLLITPEGQVKLIDMGLARLKRADRSAADLTASGVTLGTFDYIAPEQARDPRNADVRSDIYSLGCTFFYMLAGRPPFPEGTVLQKLLQHQGDQPPDVRQFRPELPDDAARVLRKMLAKDPRHRYRDSADLVEELTLLAYQIGLRPGSRVARILGAPRGRTVSLLQRHLPWMAPVAALVCIAIALHFFPFPSQGDPSPPAWPEARPADQSSPPQQPLTGGPGSQASVPQGREQPAPPKQAGKSPPRASSGANATMATGPQPVLRKSPSPDQRVGPEESVSGGRVSADQVQGGRLRVDPLAGKLTPAEETSPSLSVVSGAEAASGGLTGAAGAAAEPNTSPAAPSPVPARTGLLLVSDRPQGENEFPTLQAACRAAVNGDVVELRYNGPRVEQPITLANLRLTIRAGKDYQPVIVFRPDQSDPVKYPRSMFTVAAGRLTLANLALELQVPRQVPAESWSLFETRGSQTVRLVKCVLTVCNASDQLRAYQPDVAFFRTRSVPDAGVLGGEQGPGGTPAGTPAVTPPATIDLADCIARGEAVFLCVADVQPVHLIWENGLVVTTEQLVWAYGSQEAPQPGQMLQIELRHLTAVVRGGFYRMTQTLASPHYLDTQIYCADSILMAGPGAPLIDQEGVDTLEELRQQIAWKGDRDFYEHFDIFWSVCNLDEEALPMMFEDWQSYWGSEEESLPMKDCVLWKKLPERDRPLHTHGPADYALADSTDTRPNPAHDADAGFQADKSPPTASGFPADQPTTLRMVPAGAPDPAAPPGAEEPQRGEVAPD